MMEMEMPSLAPKLCGRPTRANRPCRQRIPDPRFEVACRQHATETEAELAAARHDAYHQGYRDAQESARRFESFRIEQLQQRISELEQATKPPRRMTEPTGRQIVEVGGHAYAWGGTEPLTVGDEVWLPDNDVSRVRIGPGPYRGEVTDLGTDYTGPLKQIIRRA